MNELDGLAGLAARDAMCEPSQPRGHSVTGDVTEPVEILASDWCPDCHGDGGFPVINRDGEPDDVTPCGTCDSHGCVTL